MDKPRKQRSDKGKRRAKGQPPVHIQGWLSPNDTHPREKSAVRIYRQMIAGMSTKEAIREAFIAYGEMTQQGWQGAPTELTLNNTLQKSIRQMLDLVERMNSIDFSAVNTDNARARVQEVQRDMSAFALNTRNMMGAISFAEDDE